MRIMESVSNPAYSILLVGDSQIPTIDNPYHLNVCSQTPPPANPAAGYYPSFSSLSTYYTTSYSSPSPYPSFSHSVDSSFIESMDEVEAIAITADATSVHVEEHDCETVDWKDLLSYFTSSDDADDGISFAAICTTTTAAYSNILIPSIPSAF